MKKFLVLSALTVCLAAKAQTNIVTQPFYSTVTGWFSSQNTNLASTFATDKVDVNIGAAYVNNVNTASTLGIEYLIARPLSLEEETYNAGIAGTILAQEAGFGLNASVVDMRFTGHIDVGYNFQDVQTYLKGGIRVKKALTENTFTGLDLSADYIFNNNGTRKSLSPTIEIFAGFKF
jgi:hypothetical protein